MNKVKFKKGQEITWKEGDRKRRAIVRGYPGEVWDKPPKKMKDPFLFVLIVNFG